MFFLPELHKTTAHQVRGVYRFGRVELFFIFVPYNDELDLSPTLVDQFVVEDLKSRELQESQRVLYVAMTRAKKYLFVLGRKTSEKFLGRSFGAGFTSPRDWDS